MLSRLQHPRSSGSSSFLIGACGLAAWLPAVAVASPAADGPLHVADCEIFDGLVERWEGAVEALGVPGASIAIVMDGEIYALASFGVRNPARDPVDADTMFYIASCTKTFTAGALARLAEQGKVDLDAPVRTYLPRFELASEGAADAITVRDLLCHRPGINSFPIVFLDAYTGQITEDRYYHWLAEVQPTGEVTYTNVHFTLAGRVLEAVTGKPWKDALAEQLFEPAGMERTTAYASRMYADPNVALPMQRAPDGGFEACAVRKTDQTMHAAGGTGTSARDGARWLQLQLREGELEGKAVFEPATMRAMRERQSDKDPDGRIRRLDGFGLGWMLGTYRGRPYVTHGGGYVGTAAHLSFLPEEGLGVVVLANGSPAGQAFSDVVSIDIYDRLLGEEGHEDLLPDYIERVAEAGAEPARRDDLVAAGKLSLEPGSYVGRFTNEHWGDVLLTLDGGELHASFGTLGLGLGAAGEDRFVGRSGAGDDLQGEFRIEDGRVLGLVIDDGSYRIRLERVE